jgi:hypothetical protein
MRRLLALGVLVVACSGGATQNGAVPGGSGSAMSDPDPSAGRSPMPSVAGSTSAAGDAPTASGSNQGGGSASGASGQSTGGGPISAGSGGVAGEPSQAGATTGGSSSGGSQSDGGTAGESSGGAAGGSGEGGTPADPCDGVAHWSPTDKITDYTPRPADAPGDWRGDLRVFGGILWAAQATQFCQTYPGHGDPSGWIKVATCAGGPIDETAPCQCAAGACCDGCYLRSKSYSCGEVVRSVRCSPPDAEEGDYWSIFCDGISAGDCTRWGAHTKYASGSCASGVPCQSSSVETTCAP